ncbi:MAG: class I SAM-dependent methyltransferase [Bryobacteraceae bacterium]
MLTAAPTECPVCGVADTGERWRISGFTVRQCGSCTVMYVGEKLSNEELGAWYAKLTDNAYSEENARCLRYYYDNLAARIRTYQPRGRRLFDVGCSRGWFFESMPEWECWGNEIASNDAREADSRAPGRVYQGAFNECTVDEGAYDAVTFQDVFDHLPDPHESLAKAYAMLRPGGLLVIKVHDFGCLYAKLSGPSFYALIPPYHLFYYNRRSLEHLLGTAGFLPLDFAHMAHLLQVKTVFERLSKNDTASMLYKLSQALANTGLGQVTFRKNLHDIVTVFARKPAS